jgi:uncharacterized protein (DUF1778 family)
MPTEAERRAIKKYHGKQAGITIRVTPEQKERILQAVNGSGDNVKGFILKAIDEHIARLRGKQI